MHKKKGARPLFAIVLIGAILFFFTSGALLLWASTLEIPDLSTFDERKIAQSTKIYDRTGKVLLYDLHENIQRTIIPITDVSVHIKNATVAIEDAEFYEHNGIKLTAILRAILVNVGTLGYAQGGSTITQQVVKNSILTTDKTITRKIKEWILAVKLEQLLTKERILELYLNESPYGGSIYGIEEAAQTFFGKPAKDITLPEAAYLAALPQAPTYFSPYGNHKDKLEDRKNLVLERMRELGFITEEEFTEAAAYTPKFAAQRVQNISAPHFVFYVREYLEEKYGKRAIEEDGFRVITTLDATLQAQAEAVVKEYAYENEKKFKASNAALVATDPRTGEILVMVGSRDYFDTAIDGNFNIALAKRQPGSSFKPIVYAAAFEKGFTPETMVFDLETQFSTSCRYDDFSSTPPCYSPVNYDNVYRGPMSFRDALAQSVNIPAVKALYLVGINRAIELAKDMGITTLTNASRYGLTLVLGGGEVTLLDMTAAYGVFANGGERVTPSAILRIEDRQGVLIEETTPTRVRVLDEQTALQISDVLSDNEARAPAFGHSSALHFPNDAVAVKTGTTNDYRDVWILGYTPNIVVGAWSGNNDNSAMEKKVAGFIVAPLWNAFMQKALALRPKETFKKPEPTPDSVPPMLRGEWQGGESYTIDSMSGKLATEFTPKETQQKRVVFDVHSILHWVDKNNPQGARPVNPGEDAQYMNWEYPVQLWKLSQGIKEGDRSWIPTGYDTVHTAESAPRVQIVSPLSDTTHSLATPLSISLQATGTYALTKADFFVNGIQVGTSNRFPFMYTITPSEQGITAGPATLSVVVYDGVLNKTEVTATIFFTE
jgi:1A family penicillin-binding protein